MRPDGPRDPVAGPDSGPEPPFPLRLDGEVIRGFGRGSKELGIPTANIPISGLTVGGQQDVESGVYYGWAGLSSTAATEPSPLIGSQHHSEIAHAVDKVTERSAAVEASSDSHHGKEKETLTTEEGAVYPMVMSIGWNPVYKNTARSVEVHIMHRFPQDFYGSHLNLIILGIIRPEYDYVSKDSLVEDIMTDIKVAGRSLERPAYAKFRDDAYLLDFNKKDKVAS